MTLAIINTRRKTVDLTLFEPLSGPRLKEEFVARLEELILTGKIAPGRRLPPERDLAARMGVSRPVIHEGILILENRGLVILRPRHGVVVQDYRRNGTLDLLLSLIQKQNHQIGPGLTAELEHVRLYMEQDMIRMICQQTPPDADALREMARINQEIRRTQDPRELARQDFLFHRHLSLASGNSVYALLMNTLKPAHIDLLIPFYQEDPRRHLMVADYHDRLLAALEQRNLDLALTLLERSDSFGGYRNEDTEGFGH